MNPTLILSIVLALIAVFLILRLRDVLGTRGGFEPPAEPKNKKRSAASRKFKVIEGESKPDDATDSDADKRD